jgi:small subunit ribosomal protein S10
MKFRIFLRSFDNDLINLASKDLSLTLSKTDCDITGIISLPVKIKRFCVLRSPHVDKDSREHFEIRIHKRILDIYPLDSNTRKSLVTVNLPSGVKSTIK